MRAPLIMAAPEPTLGAPGATVVAPALAWRGAGETKTDVVVPVVGLVVVAVAGADVRWIVVPGTAAQNPPDMGRPGFVSTCPKRA